MTLDDLMTPTIVPSRTNPLFQDAVLKVFAEHGNLSLQQARIRTGIDHDTLSRMKKGDVPRIDKIIDFARGFGLDVNEWLEIAGYEPIRSSADSLANQLLTQAQESEDAREAVRRLLDHVSFGTRESPTERFKRRKKDAAGALYSLGFNLPPPHEAFGGDELTTDAAADREYASWLEDVERQNPGKQIPAELYPDLE